MKKFKRLMSILLAVMLVFSMTTLAVESVSAAVDEKGYYVPPEGTETNRYYFYMPEDWENELSTEVGAYWVDNDLGYTSVSWPGYKAHKADAENVFYVDCPTDVSVVIWNNYIDGGVDKTTYEYSLARQTIPVGTEYYDPGESPNYPDGITSFDNMIYVLDPEKISVTPTVDEGTAYGGEWYYYYGNGEYGFQPTREVAEDVNGVFVTDYYPPESPLGNYTPDFDNDSNKIYFNVAKSGWNNVKTVYCHIWRCDGTGEWPSWQSKKEKCDYNLSTGIASYDLSKTENYISKDDGKEYCVIFSANTDAQTYNTIMSGKCIGDTLYCTGEQIENPEDSEKKSIIAVWTNNPDCGPEKKITSTGNIVGTAYPDGATDATLVADYLIAYYNDPAKTDLTQDIINELEVSPVDVMNAVIDKIGGDDPDGRISAIKKILINCNDPTKDSPSLVNTSITLGVGESSRVRIWIPSQVIISGGTNSSEIDYTIKDASDYKFVSSNSKVATVDSQGYVKAKGVGTAVITVTNQYGKSAECTINVRSSPTSVKTNQSSYILGVGDTSVISAITNSGSWSTDFTWSSSNESVVTVGTPIANRATIRAVGTGTATVTVKTYNGKTASCKVTIKNAPTSVKINPSSITLGVGESYTISESTNSGSYANASHLVWRTSDSDVVALTKTNGNKLTIKATGVGTATVTIRVYTGVTATCNVTVKSAPTSVKLNATSVTLGKGESYTISESTNSGSFANASNLKWSSSNTKVATVTKGSANKATITAKGTGTAYIKITLYNGKTAQCKVTVKSAPTSVKLNTTNVTLGVGENYTISESTNSGSFANADNLKWSSSNTKVATVTKGSANKATITAKGTGTAYIKITLYNGKTAQCKVTVKPAPSSVKLSKTSITLSKGQTYTISESTNSGTYANASNLKWSSSDTSVATVAKGSGNKATITAKSKGTAYVKITLYNGKTATCKVTVK